MVICQEIFTMIFAPSVFPLDKGKDALNRDKYQNSNYKSQNSFKVILRIPPKDLHD